MLILDATFRKIYILDTSSDTCTSNNRFLTIPLRKCWHFSWNDCELSGQHHYLHLGMLRTQRTLLPKYCSHTWRTKWRAYIPLFRNVGRLQDGSTRSQQQERHKDKYSLYSLTACHMQSPLLASFSPPSPPSSPAHPGKSQQGWWWAKEINKRHLRKMWAIKRDHQPPAGKKISAEWRKRNLQKQTRLYRQESLLSESFEVAELSPVTCSVVFYHQDALCCVTKWKKRKQSPAEWQFLSILTSTQQRW